MTVQGVLRYAGGKSRMVSDILPHLPPHISEYREPFLGGGSIALAVSELFPSATVWVNDIDPPLVDFWVALRDQPGELVEACLALHTRTPVTTQARLLFAESAAAMRSPAEDPVVRAALYYYRNRTSFSGSYDAGFSESAWSRWRESGVARIRNLTVWSARIKRWRVSCTDYEVLFDARGGENVLILADPPYDIKENNRLYAGHRDFDHERFERVAFACTVPTLITYARQPGRFEHWTIRQTIDHAYSMSSRLGYREAQRNRVERIYTNYAATRLPIRPTVARSDEVLDKAARLRTLIEGAGLTQLKAASLIGVELRTVQRWLASDRRIPAYAFKTLESHGRRPRGQPRAP